MSFTWATQRCETTEDERQGLGNWCLSPEFHAVHLPTAQETPQFVFCLSWFVAHRAGTIALNRFVGFGGARHSLIVSSGGTRLWHLLIGYAT
jgi:hypothetical protein